MAELEAEEAAAAAAFLQALQKQSKALVKNREDYGLSCVLDPPSPNSSVSPRRSLTSCSRGQVCAGEVQRGLQSPLHLVLHKKCMKQEGR